MKSTKWSYVAYSDIASGGSTRASKYSSSKHHAEKPADLREKRMKNRKSLEKRKIMTVKRRNASKRVKRRKRAMKMKDGLTECPNIPRSLKELQRRSMFRAHLSAARYAARRFFKNWTSQSSLLGTFPSVRSVQSFQHSRFWHFFAAAFAFKGNW